MSRCAPRSDFVNENSLVELFSKSEIEIKKQLRSGSNTSLDILATAIYLKFYYAVSGFYFDATVSAPGALSRYNGGGVKNYAGHVLDNIQNIDGEICLKDKEYLENFSSQVCILSEDKSVCDMTTAYFKI